MEMGRTCGLYRQMRVVCRYLVENMRERATLRLGIDRRVKQQWFLRKWGELNELD